MPVFDLAEPKEVANQEAEIMANPYVEERDSAPGFFEGSSEAVGKGFETGGLNLINLGASLAHKTGFIDDEQARTFDQAFLDVKNQLMPNPQTTGFLGKVLHPLSTILTEAIPATVLGGPATGAAVVGGAEGVAKNKELIGEGVDETTALKVGALTGVTAGAGLLLPAAIGTGIVSKIASGAAINTAVGGAQRGLTGKLLRDNGYPAMADQYKVLDGMALLTDAVLGSAFGLLHTANQKIESKDLLPSDIDTGLAANNIRQLEIDSAPGIPTDIATRNSHVSAIEKATEQLLFNERVNVGDVFKESNFIAKQPNTEVIKAWDEANREARFGNYDLLHISAENDLNVIARHLSSELYDKREALEIQKKQYAEQIQDAIVERRNAVEVHTAQDFFVEQNKLAKATSERSRKIYQNRIDRMQTENAEAIQKAESTDTPLLAEAREKYQQADYGLRELAPEVSKIYRLAEEIRGPIPEPNATPVPHLPEAEAISEPSLLNPSEIIEVPEEAPGAEATPKEEEIVETTEEAGFARSVVTDIIKDKPDLKILNDDGEVVSAAEALAEADKAYAQAERESSLFEVAVNCFIRNGL